MPRAIEDLIRALDFDPARAPELWKQALTHRSTEGQPHYERLEFLGDAVLKLVVSQWLYGRSPDMSEGEMTKVRASVVSDATLARVAEQLDLSAYLTVGAAERGAKGKGRVGILASSLEAVLGVIHLSEGPAAADAFLHRWLAQELDEALRVGGQDNFKAVLQEYTQGRFKTLPEYRLVGEIGPEHDRRYDIAVYIEGDCLGIGRGTSKKSAEQQAAAKALDTLKEQR
ncbi:MAG TPA: ribonuclease III [Oscillatoriaceae cyanobacterium]